MRATTLIATLALLAYNLGAELFIILTGVDKPIQICSTGSTVNDILNMAVIAACRLGQ